MATNSYLNPQILPSSRDIKPHDHRKLINGALIMAFAALILGLLYWWGMQKKVVESPPQPSLGDEIRIRQEVAATLNTVPIQTSPTEAKNIANQLSKVKIGIPVDGGK